MNHATTGRSIRRAVEVGRCGVGRMLSPLQTAIAKRWMNHATTGRSIRRDVEVGRCGVGRMLSPLQTAMGVVGATAPASPGVVPPKRWRGCFARPKAAQ
ncbi:MAG: hypothetical protein H0T73_23710 [Ardenticatenales bacterium]|nr:hypothetical protein [Ardenticatenales bacterium]